MTQRFPLPIAPARQIAFQVLKAVAAGEYASDALRARSRNLSPRDAGLAAQIVFGALRFQAQLDYLIFFYGRRKVEMLDDDVVLALRTAMFQLRYLQRIPAHAAVHDTVELVKSIKRAAAGLVNAVLRKVRRDPIPWPDRAIELSCPEWLLQRWGNHFGQHKATGIAQAALAEPIPYIRLPSGTEAPSGLELAATEVPGAFRVLSSQPEDKGELRLHDIGSQGVLTQLGLEPGHAYLDLCAAPGNKTRQALETPLSLAIACDVSLRRLEMVPPLCPRVVLDGTQPLPFSRQFDRIFIDAPCSGTGTCGRNPEIKWRVQERDFKIFGERQRQLIEAAVPLLAPRGKLLYATCSLEPEENEDVLEQVLAEHHELELESERWRLPGSSSATPSTTGPLPSGQSAGDGFYGALLRRR